MHIITFKQVYACISSYNSSHPISRGNVVEGMVAMAYFPRRMEICQTKRDPIQQCIIYMYVKRTGAPGASAFSESAPVCELSRDILHVFNTRLKNLIWGFYILLHVTLHKFVPLFQKKKQDCLSMNSFNQSISYGILQNRCLCLHIQAISVI